MDINSLLKEHICSCGKKHNCSIEGVYIERNAAARLYDICSNYNSILIVSDQNTRAAAGDGVFDALKSKKLHEIVFSGNEILIPNEKAIKAVEDSLADTDIIIGIGSGVIQDLCKYISFYHKLPYIIVATAPSMDGYASNGAAMITNGMKETYPAGLPKAIIADPEVLRNAPIDMLKSGYGDIIGKYSALNDWKLSRLINGEYFCDYIYNATFDQIKNVISLSDGILKRDGKSVAALMEALVVVGIMMSYAGSSRPASGSEHHLSHFFEITGILTSTPYLSHGIDVAYSTVVTAKLREQLLTQNFSSEPYRLPADEYIKTMQSLYLSSADGCIRLQEKMGRYKNSNSHIYLEKQSEIKKILSEMPKASEIEALLGNVGLYMKDFYSFYGTERINNAIMYAKDLKDRYTVLWLYYDLFGKRFEEADL